MTQVGELSLNDGHRIAQIGFGTWPLTDAEAEIAVAHTLAAGYRLQSRGWRTSMTARLRRSCCAGMCSRGWWRSPSRG